jgi:hypothetical protein
VRRIWRYPCCFLEDLVRGWEHREFAHFAKERLSEIAIQLPKDLRHHVPSASNGTGYGFDRTEVVGKPLSDCPPAPQGVLHELIRHGVQRRIGPRSFQGARSRIDRELTEGWCARTRSREGTAERRGSGDRPASRLELDPTGPRHVRAVDHSSDCPTQLRAGKPRVKQSELLI